MAGVILISIKKCHLISLDGKALVHMLTIKRVVKVLVLIQIKKDQNKVDLVIVILGVESS